MKPKSKTKNKKTSKPKARKYQAHYLALILVSALLLEGILIGATSKIDWLVGAQVLDMSAAVSETASDVAVFFQPMADTIASVNQFYYLAATETIPLLDMTDAIEDASFVINGVNEFYSQAATQMAELLDMSSTSTWPARVAGVSITVDPSDCK